MDNTHRECPFCDSPATFASERPVHHPCGADVVHAFDVRCAGCPAMVSGPVMRDAVAAYDAAYAIWDRRAGDGR